MKTFNSLRFKNAALIFVLMIAFVGATMAQPQYYNYNTTGTNNAFPFNINSATGKTIQTLYLAGAFANPTPAPSGNITTLYIQAATTGSPTYTSLTITMGQTTDVDLPTGAWYTGTMTTVYDHTNANLSGTAGQFFAIPLDVPFNYNPTLSLVVQITQCGYSGTGIGVCYSSLVSGTKRHAGPLSPVSCPHPWGNSINYTTNTGIDVSAVTPVTCVHTYAHQLSNATVLFQAVSAVSPYIGWVAGATATVRRTTDGGATWTNANPNTGVISGDVYNITAVDANNAWLTTSPSATNIYRTTNGGTNWTQVFTQAGGFIDGIVFTNVNTGFAYGDPVGGRWSLWRTTNGGLNWDSTGLYVPQVGSEAGWNNAIKVKGTNIWYGTNNTKIYHTTNAGVSWSPGVTTFLDSYCMHFNDANNGLAGGETLNKTTNGGATYTLLSAPGTGNITGLSGANSTYYWYTRGDSLYATTNGGTNWSLAFVDTKGLWGVDVATLNNGCGIGWAVGDSGKIIRINVDSLVGISSNGNGIPNIYRLEQNYPNPFNPSTKIAYELPKAGLVSMVVFDILGREVATLVNEVKPAGKYSVNFNASSLASGVYFYRITAGDFTESKKMLLIK